MIRTRCFEDANETHCDSYGGILLGFCAAQLKSDALPFIWWHSFGFLRCAESSDLARDLGPTASTLGEAELVCIEAEVIRGIILCLLHECQSF